MRTCTNDDCEDPYYARGFCRLHYQHDQRLQHKECSVDDCTTPWSSGGLCNMHYLRFRNTGTTDQAPPRLRTCKYCKQKFPKEEFPIASQTVCVTCYPTHREHLNAIRIPRTQEIREIIKNLREKQEGRCAICHVFEEEAPKGTLFLDHNHKTGQLRDLLCHDCNIAIGNFQDDVNLLQVAISYLRKHQSS